MLSDVHDVRERARVSVVSGKFQEPARGLWLKVQQRPWEIEALLAILRSLNPRKLLEVGTYQGGTLFHTLQAIPAGAEFVALDLLEDTEQYPDYAHLPELWGQWADLFGHKLIVVTGDSHQPIPREAVRAEAPFDFAFIDADHDFGMSREDFCNYGAMVRDGGIIALHDIGPAYGVHRLWAEIQNAGYVTQELSCSALDDETRHGIGVVYVGQGKKALTGRE